MKHIIRIWLIAFALNAIWEVSHARLYTVGGQPVLWPRLAQSIFFDAWIVFGMYGVFALLWRDKHWYARRLGPFVPFVLLGAAIATGVETHAVYIAHRWEYRAIMPTVLGIGLSPVLQMMVLPAVSLMIARFAWHTDA